MSLELAGALFFGGLSAAGLGGLMRLFFAEWRESQEKLQRESRIAELHGRPAAAPAAAPTSKKERRAKKAKEQASQDDVYKGLQATLSRAQILMRKEEFYLMCAGFSLAFGAFGMLVSRTPAVAVLLAAAGFYAPRWWVGMKVKRRRSKFTKQLPDTLQLMAQSVQAGKSLAQAIDTVAKNGPQPTAYEFGRVANEAKFNMPLAESLRKMVLRMESTDLEMVATAIGVQSQVGGSLAGILDTVAKTIREREHLHGEVMALTAQQDMMGKVLMLLPIGVGLIFYMLKPEYMSVLTDSSCGKMILGAAGFEIMMGYFVAKRLTKVEL